MAVAKKAPVRPKRTKSEVQQAFEELQEEVAASRETSSPKADEAVRLHEGQVRQSVEGLTVDSVVGRMSGLSLEISKALGDLSEKLVEQTQLLASTREAVQLERQELSRMHKLDIAATSLDQLVQDYARQREELEAAIAAQRLAWEEEKRNTERDRKEQEDTLKKQRQRDIDEYEYKKTQERKKAQDKYDEELRLQEKQNREKQEALDRNWSEREAALKDREDELARLSKEVAEFPARLEKEREQAAAEAARVARQAQEQQLLIQRKDSEAEQRVAALQIKTLEEAAARQAVQLTALQKQVDEAKQQVQDIAVRAIEGASGSKALTHINQIAMEQAKNRPQG
jgi:colicin import membrane protein